MLYHRVFPVEHNASGPIVVYQMGKVGSWSIEASLRRLDLSVPVYHCHVLERLDAIDAALRRILPNPHEEPGGSIDEIARARGIRAKFMADADRPWTFISMVRDPVARNLSAFFQSVTERIPDFYQRLNADDLPTAFVAEHFLKDEVTHNVPIVWFDQQLKPLLDIDVFATPFPHAQGFQIYAGRRARLLIMRLESFPDCVGPAMRQFLGISCFVLASANTAEDKAYADVYRRVRREIALPDHYLERMYESKLARHFYTDEERAQFRRTWSGRSAPSAGPLR
jgi:hypothetical protein